MLVQKRTVFTEEYYGKKSGIKKQSYVKKRGIERTKIYKQDCFLKKKRNVCQCYGQLAVHVSWQCLMVWR